MIGKAFTTGGLVAHRLRLGRPEVIVLKTVAVTLVLVSLVVVGVLRRDGRVAGGDLAARAFGYVLRVELTLERGRTAVAPPERAGLLDRCSIIPDTVTRAIPWR